MESPDYDHEKPTKTLANSDVDAEAHTSKQQRLALKQHWSAYFTILAAAFGLISDGCKCSRVLAFVILPSYFLNVDQNNLMTMANVRACAACTRCLSKFPSPFKGRL